MSLKSRREYVNALRARYKLATVREKQAILNSLVATAGYHRRYAMALLAEEESVPPLRKQRQCKYDETVKTSLIAIWEASNYCCSKRLVPFLPLLIQSLENHGHLVLSADLRSKLLSISAASADRLLKDARRNRGSKGFSLIRSGNSLSKEIPIRTFADEQEPSVGFLECDLVAHCGGNISGQFIHTLTMTDIASAWTECIPILYKDKELVKAAIERGCSQFPFPIKGIDTDNGSEFINGVLLDFCKAQGLKFTRSRPYRKNDQAHVEERNGQIVRALAGYQRLEGEKKLNILNELYWSSRLFYNYFQPCQKIISKIRDGSKVRKQYAPAKTPYQRMVEIGVNPNNQYLKDLDPITIQLAIKNLQDQLDSKTKSAKTQSTQQTEEKSLQRKHNQRVNRPHKKSGRPRFFSIVLTEIHQMLNADPMLTPLPMMQLLNQRYPGSFQSKHKRILQREIARWHAENPNKPRRPNRLRDLQVSDFK